MLISNFIKMLTHRALPKTANDERTFALRPHSRVVDHVVVVEKNPSPTH